MKNLLKNENLLLINRKMLFNFFFFLFIAISGMSNAQERTEIDPQFFKENIVITDAYVRSISDEVYVREMKLTSYGEENYNFDKISFQNIRFSDDGKGNDLRAGDGIFTSVETFEHNDIVKQTEGRSISVLKTPIADSAFNKNGPKALLKCDIEFGVGGCRAEEYGWCSKCCFAVSNCSFELGWG